MGNIQDFLTKIRKERYGKDVREAIAGGIEQCYQDGKAGAVDPVARGEIEEVRHEQNVHFATGSEITVDTAKGGARFVGAKGGQYKSKNILDQKATSTVVNGVTFTKMADGTWLVNGTADSDKNAYVYLYPLGSYKYEYGKNYRLTGCPSGGGSETYKLTFDSNYSQKHDVGNGVTFSIPESASDKIFAPWIFVTKGATVNNLVFKPMIVDATLYPNTTYNDYEPYGLKVSGDMGLVDLASLSWIVSNGTYLSNSLNDLLKGSSADSAIGNIYAEKYNTTSYSGLGSECIAVRQSTMAYMLAVKSNSTPSGYLAYEVADGATPSQYAEVIKEYNNVFDGEMEFGYLDVNGNIQSPSSAKTSVNRISVKDKKNITVLLEKPANIFGCFFSNTNTLIGTRIVYYSVNKADFTVPTNADNFMFTVSVYDQQIVAFTESKTVFVPTSQPLAEGDSIVKVGDKWYEEIKMVHRIYDGSDKYSYNLSGGYAGAIFVRESGAKLYGDIIADGYKCVRSTDDYKVGTALINISNPPNSICFYIKDTEWKDVDELKKWLQSNPIEFYFEIETPIYKEITDQATLYQLESYEGQTHISTADGLAEITVAYGKSDTVATALNAERIAKKNEAVLEQKIEYLTNAIISMGGTV